LRPAIPGVARSRREPTRNCTRGFIGAGAVVRRDRLVTGVTTAATLWLITVIGLIIGAGYIAPGLGLVAIAFVFLFVFKRDGFQIADLSLDYRKDERSLRLHLQWSSSHGQIAVPGILDELRALPGIERLTWHPAGAGHLAE
jgi:putative Mg2+ transporter-C (MgtC) family protein